MEKEEYIKHIKKLLMTYHPDKCTDKNLMNAFNEITIKLNITLNQLENKKVEINKTLIEDKNFNVFSFRYYLGKIKSIGIGKNSILNKDYLIFKNFLISEIGKSNKDVASHFSQILSENSITNDSIKYFVSGYANYSSIIQNYYQYKDQSVKGCIKIGNSYFNDYIKNSNINEIETKINEIIMWFKIPIKELYNGKEYY